MPGKRASHLSVNPRRWLYRSYLKDAKLKTRERYYDYDCSSSLLQEPTNVSAIHIIPHGCTWRKYLKLLQRLITKHSDENSSSLHWILLESAAELMEHRNQAPTCMGESRREFCLAQERNILMRLVQQQSSLVQVFPDMSVRDLEQDEWDWLEYETLTLEDRSRHAFLRAARMIHDRNTSQQVWLVSDQPIIDDQVQLDEGVEIIGVSELLSRLFDQKLISQSDAEMLKNLKEICDEEYAQMNRSTSTSMPDNSLVRQDIEYSDDDIQQGLRNKDFFRGRLEVSKDNPREAFVAVDHVPYFIDKRHFHRAFHGDRVIVQLLPEAEWGRPVGRHRIVHYRDDDDDENIGLDDDVVPPVPSARVLKVDLPSRRTFVATMVNEPRDNDSHVLVFPMDVRVPKIRIHAKLWTTYIGKRLKIQVDDWEAEHTYPSGRCIDIIGDVGDLETEVAALLLENQVELEPFSVSALSCLPSRGESWAIAAEEIHKRRDLRYCRQIFSVDPPGCQDIDDTMHAMELPNGDIEFGVHIADVTHFVAHNSALDKEAQARSTTFYLVDRRFDMLPAILSSNLCSLHGNVDRLAVSVIWVMSPDLQTIKSTWFGRSVVNNCAAMTYDQADRILQGQSPDSPESAPPPALTAGGPVDSSLLGDLKQSLSLLTGLAQTLRGRREAIGGAVDLSSGDIGSELKFTLVDGKPVQVVAKADKEIHHTIAEMMILANTTVASKIYEYFPDSALLRIHRSVEEERFDDLKDILEAANIQFNGKTNAEVAQSLKLAQQRVHSRPAVGALLLSLATRAMSEAQYVSAGDNREGAGFSHYGLGLQYYTHFTSPIRRYADVVVHKQLFAALERENESHALQSSVKTDSIRTRREMLPALPESNVISIMAGEGLIGSVDEDEAFLDYLIEGAADLALDSTQEKTQALSSTTLSATEKHPSLSTYYDGSQISLICERLNLHNRLAKYSSFECQRLFLSLYFRDNAEVADAVVLQIRANGLWVYIPRFEIKSPVYVKDASGQVQIDPQLLGLAKDAGMPPTLGFSASGDLRRFVTGKCDHIEGDDERLEVSVPEGSKSLTVRPLDVVRVIITCDNWDIRARVPTPRVQLIAAVSESLTSRIAPSSSTVKVDSTVLERSETLMPVTPASTASHDATIFSVISSLNIQPVLPSTLSEQSFKTRIAAVDRKVSLPGRFVYSSFANPDSRLNQQEVAQQSAATAAAQRRTNAIAQSNYRSEYDTTKQYEREAMVRQQRLAADKRNARISKSKKTNK